MQRNINTNQRPRTHNPRPHTESARPTRTGKWMYQTTAATKLRPPGGHKKSAAQVTPDSRVSPVRPTFLAHQAVAKKGPLASPLLQWSTHRNCSYFASGEPHGVDNSSLKMNAGRLFGLKFFISCYEMTNLESLPASSAPTFSRSRLAGHSPCTARRWRSPHRSDHFWGVCPQSRPAEPINIITAH